MLTRFACAALTLLAALSSANSLTWKTYFAGSPVGASTYERSADGKVTESTTINLVSVKLQSSMTGRYEGNRLVEFECAEDVPQGKFKLSLKGGKFKVSAGSKEKELPFNINQEVTVGNLLPQLTVSALLKVDYSKKVPQDVKAFMPEGGTELVLKITPLMAKTVLVNGVLQSVRPFKMALPTVEAEYILNDQDLVVAMDVPSQKLRILADGWDALYKDPLAAFPELSPATLTPKADSAVMVAMRDGIKLATDVIRPDAEGKYPAILVRTPYGRSGESLAGGIYAKRGYVFVTQDCRGREDSEGEWDPFVNEGKDGYDTIQWIAQQPWSNGKVGTIGASYAGYVQWAAAVEQPPALVCMIPQVSPPDAMHNLPYEFGVFALWPDLWWSFIVSDKKTNLKATAIGLPHAEKLTTLPLSKVDDAVLGKNIPFFDKWLTRTTMKDWKGWDFLGKISSSKVPSLMISGWWDGDGIGTKLNWAAMRAAGRKDQWLIYGPWAHAFNTTSKIGNMEYGPTAIIDLDSVYLRWFDHWLKGRPVGLEKMPKVKAFVAGANEWINLTDWPEDSTPIRTLYLAADGSATGFGKHGQLLEKPGSALTSSTYTYDPSKAVVPAEMLKPDPTKASFKVDLSKDKNSLVFKSAPILKRTAIAGPIQIELEFATSALDTDLFAGLVDEDEAGTAMIIGQTGKIRGSYLGGFDETHPLKPGKIYKATILPWDTAYEFKPGHRICLVIGSSGFPMFSRNLGTAEPILTAIRMVPQINTIFHSHVHPSRVAFRVLWER